MMEIETKFFVADLAGVADRLEDLDAKLHRPRILEQNWRYDTPDHALEADHRMLRLRQSHTVTLTYKSPAVDVDGTSQRTEYETEVADIEQIRNLLGALGYVVTAKYEKYRTEYTLAGLTITLDEMPFGDFVEIEGHQIPDIQGTAADLGLDWDANITKNYLTLFSRLKQALSLEGAELTFKELGGHSIMPEILGVRAAD